MRHNDIYPADQCTGRVLESTKYVDSTGNPVKVCADCGMVIETDADEA